MPPPKTESEEIVVTISNVKSYPSKFTEGKSFYILSTRERVSMTGEADTDSILVNCEYRVSGQWDDHPTYGRQFKFKHMAIREPVSRVGVAAYLSRYAPHIGYVLSNRICDTFGAERAVSMLRDKPEEVASAIKGLNPDRCSEASKALKLVSANEETRINLLTLLDGKGFRKALPDQLIAKYGAAADKTVKNNPFVLLEDRYPGCGFLLVFEFYKSLGYDASAMKCQVLALHFILDRKLDDGSTWGLRSDVYTKMSGLITSGLKFGDAISQAIAENKVRSKVDDGGIVWLATKQNCDEEAMIANLLVRLMDASGENGDGESSGEKDNGKIFENEDGDGDSFGCPFDEANETTDSVEVLFSAEDHKPINAGDVLASAFEETSGGGLKLKTDPRDRVAVIPKPVRSQLSADRDLFTAGDTEDDGLSFLAETDGLNEAYEVASELVQELDQLCDRLQDHPADKCAAFLEGVIESLAGISETIEKRRTATDRQIKALRAMIVNCMKWVETESEGDWDE